jgi:5,10-methylenetetrahydrofolate reductase
VLSVRRWSVRHAGAMERLYRWFVAAAPALRRGVTWVGAARADRWVRPIERSAKRLFFDCHMCGQCALSASGMACPMNCPKRHRNGPCGGVAPDGSCEVDPAMRCVWLEALDGAKRMRDGAAIARVQPPVDHRQRGTSTWVKVILRGADAGMADAAAAPLAPRTEGGPLERALRSGRFVVTAEISPPDSADPDDLLRRAEVLRGAIDAVNVTDAAGANCHMSSLAASALLIQAGHTPVFQVACRDRNRIAIQADLVGAAALGVRNVLCVTGDHVVVGDHPEARPVFDLDSVSLLEIARGMRDRGTYASGRTITTRPDYMLGATANPFVPPFADRVANLERKITAGAQFVQTQYCFDLARFEDFMREVRARGLHRRCQILAGAGPLTSARSARWMNAHVPGVHIPEDTIRRLEGAADPAREGTRICVELVRALRAIEGVAGVHLMAHRRENLVAEIVAESGLAAILAAAGSAA